MATSIAPRVKALICIWRVQGHCDLCQQLERIYHRARVQTWLLQHDGQLVKHLAKGSIFGRGVVLWDLEQQ